KNNLYFFWLKSFSHGLTDATRIAFVPATGSQPVRSWQINAEPLSLRIRVGAPYHYHHIVFTTSRARRMAAMSFAIVSLGTAVPATIVDQADASEVAKKLCCRTEEQSTWLPTIYAGSGVRTRRLTLDQGVLNDSMHGTQHSGSVFLPKGGDDRGPTTA